MLQLFHMGYKHWLHCLHSIGMQVSGMRNCFVWLQFCWPDVCVLVLLARKQASPYCNFTLNAIHQLSTQFIATVDGIEHLHNTL